MTKLPKVSGKKIIKILESFGYKVIRQRGSHIRLNHKEKPPITVPDHKIIGSGLLSKILKDAEIERKEFERHFNK